MKSTQPFNPIPRFARLSPAALARLRHAVAEAAVRVRIDEAQEGPLSPWVKRGPRPEMEVHASLRFVPMKKETARKLRRSDDPRRGRRPAEALRVGAEEIKALQKAEPQLLAWVAESDENAVLFTADPLKALGEAGVKLSPEQLLRLRLLRHRNLAAAVPQSPSPITKIKVSAGDR